MKRQEFENEYLIQLTNDEPIEVFGLSLYPIRVKNYFHYEVASAILKIDKDSIPDKEVISMSYLEFLIGIMEDELHIGDLSQRRLTTLFVALFRMCLNDDTLGLSIMYDSKRGKVKIGDHVMDGKMFDTIRSIILHQNDLKYNEDIFGMPPELRQDIEDYKRLSSKGRKSASVEVHQVALMLDTPLTLEHIRELTLRKFDMALQLIDRKIGYQTELMAVAFGSMSPDKTTHYLFDISSNDLEECFVEYDSTFKSKFGEISKFE